MFLVTAKVITLVSFYSPSLVCSVFFFHSFCQDQHSVTSVLEISFCSLQFNYFFWQESRKFLQYQHLFCFLLCCGSHLHLAWCHKSSPLQGPMWQMRKAGDSRQLCTSLKAVPSPMSAQGQGVSFPHVAGHVAHSFTPSYPLRDCSFPAAIQ